MLRKLYARWMYRWETALTTQDSNRIVRPVEWGFDWLDPFVQKRGLATQIYGPSGEPPTDDSNAEQAMIALNDAVIRYS